MSFMDLYFVLMDYALCSIMKYLVNLYSVFMDLYSVFCYKNILGEPS